MGISWPAEDVEKLKALWSDGVMVPQIQIKFAQKYSARRIYNKAHNLHLAKRAPGDRWKYKTPKPQHLSENTAAIDMAYHHDEPKPLGPTGDFPKGSGCRWITATRAQRIGAAVDMRWMLPALTVDRIGCGRGLGQTISRFAPNDFPHSRRYSQSHPSRCPVFAD